MIGETSLIPVEPVDDGYEGPPKEWTPVMQPTSDAERHAAVIEAHEARKGQIGEALQYARERAAAADARPFVIRNEQLGVVDRVLCRVCGKVLMALVESPEPLYTKKDGNTTTIVKLAAHQTTADYQHVKLLFDDGSRHIAVCCKKDAASLVAGEIDLERFYAHDLAQWLSEKDAAEVVEVSAYRKPILAEMGD